jgi:SAM-dependent methyltransferase
LGHSQIATSELPSGATPNRLRPCPVCGSAEFGFVFGTIKRCKKCGLCLVNPLGEYRGENETPEYFLNDYLPSHIANREGSLAERRDHIAAIKKYFRLPARPRHLDVGCALGFMLQEAKASGWESVGVETSEFAARYAEEHTGCRVYAGTLQKAGLSSESFDVVTLTDVIEHVAYPLDLLGEIYRILRPGGVVFIITPNFGSLFVRLLGPKAFGVWPDQHIVYFGPAAMTHLLRQLGYSRIVVGSKDFYPDNLRQLMRKPKEDSNEIRRAFAVSSSLGKVRRIGNRILMHIRLGDKLVAMAAK